MCRKWLKKDSFQRKPVLLITRVLKFGKISPMTQRVTFGVLAAFFMKFVLKTLHSELKTWTAFTRKYWKGFIHRFLHFIPLIWIIWLRLFFSKIHHQDQHVLRFLKWQEHKITSRILFITWSNSLKKKRKVFLTLSKFQGILGKLLIDYLKLIIIHNHLF